MSPLRIQLDRIRRGRWLVLLIVLIATGAAAMATISTGATYTGRSTLSIAAPARAPEQDTVLAQGYVEYFNETSYQQKLRAAANVPAGVSLSARLAAASPIIYVEAVADSADLARSTAAAVATAFRSDVNDGIRADQAGRIAELNKQLDTERQALSRTQGGSQDAALVSLALNSLQTRVNDIQGDTSNQLRELQTSAGVSVGKPSLVTNVGLGFGGGLVLGILAAIGLAVVRNRLTTAAEVEDRLGIEVLADIRGGRTVAAEQDQDQRLKRVANLVGPTVVHRPAVIAVAAPRRIAACRGLAVAIARRRAAQGERVIVVRTDILGRPDDEDQLEGLADVLAGRRHDLAALLRRGTPATLRVLPFGIAGDDPYNLFAPDRLSSAVAQLTRLADLVVIDAPPLLDAAESQAICGVAHDTVLVIAAGATREPDAQEALRQLRQVRQPVLGAVVVDRRLDAFVEPEELDPPLIAPATADASESDRGDDHDKDRTEALVLVRGSAVAEPASAAPADADPDMPTGPSPRPREVSAAGPRGVPDSTARR